MIDNTIIWEKWVDPYGKNIDSVEWPGYDKQDIIDTYNEENKENITAEKFNAIITPMGVIPYNEYTDCTKIFNFWVGHTNFNICKNFVSELENVSGVETLDIFTRYRFRISFGKAFDHREVIDSINQLIKNKHYE